MTKEKTVYSAPRLEYLNIQGQYLALIRAHKGTETQKVLKTLTIAK